MAPLARTDPLADAISRQVFLTTAAALLAILAVLWALEWFVTPIWRTGAISAVIFAALVPNVLVGVRGGPVPVGLLLLIFAADVTAATTGIHLGGGVDMTSGPLLYGLIIGLAGLMLSERGALLTAGLCSLEYAALAWLEHRGVLPHTVSYTRPPDRQIATVLMTGIYLFLVAWLVSYAVRQIRAGYRSQEELSLEEVHVLSHDLKNPLGAVQSSAMLAESGPNSERGEYLDWIQKSVQQALDLVENVLDADATDGSLVAPVRKPLSVQDLVEQVAAQYRLAAQEKGIALSTPMPSDLPVVQGDLSLMSRALGNLVSNAIKYTPRGGAVRVEAHVHAGIVSISVEDTGRGIEPSEQPHLFQKYRRATSGHGVEGTGLGLYIVRRIIEAHGGKVSVTSQPGKGSRFALEIPGAGSSSSLS